MCHGVNSGTKHKSHTCSLQSRRLVLLHTPLAYVSVGQTHWLKGATVILNTPTPFFPGFSHTAPPSILSTAARSWNNLNQANKRIDRSTEAFGEDEGQAALWRIKSFAIRHQRRDECYLEKVLQEREEDEQWRREDLAGRKHGLIPFYSCQLLSEPRGWHCSVGASNRSR